jgi:glycosyltransferase involved in cell wall biosynthesis
MSESNLLTAPKSRNDPCPCGSGKRYKACHGAVAVAPVSVTPDPLPAIMGAALTAQTSGELAEAERLYRQALAIDPNQADCLHMLGVVRLQRLDLVEATTLIAQAGERVGWQIASFRHNYGHALSSFLSAREPSNLGERIDQVRIQRVPLKSHDRAYCVVVIAAQAAIDALTSTVTTLAGLSQPPSSVIVMGAQSARGDAAGMIPDTLTAPMSLHLRAWLPDDVAGCLMQALGDCEEPFVTILHAGDRAVAGLAMALSDMATTGVDWAVARCRAQFIDPVDLPPAALGNAFTQLQYSPRLGAALFADGEALGSIANVLWRRDFLLSRLAERPQNFQQLCELALWQSEPGFANETAVEFQTRLPRTSSFWGRANATVEPYLALALSGELAPNPLAPSLEFDGPSFLKRALRLGLGSRMSPETLRLVAGLATHREDSEPVLDHAGLELIGFVRAENGLGESLRLLAQSCQAVALPVGLTNIPLDMAMRQTDTRFDALMVTKPTYRTRLICTNPDSLGEGNFVDGALALRHAHNIGYWYWELENLPAAWIDAGRLIDELWVATDFVAEAARKVIDKPVMKITPPVLQPVPSRPYSRAEFELPNDAFLFMFSFDFGSFPTRKNPEAVVRAFKLAFPIDQPTERAVCLVIKCQGSHTFPAAKTALLALIGDDPRIILLDKSLSRDAVTGLQTVIDCYVSLHRSEGLGLGMAECMALGKPVIATAYSGNMEFMNEGNSLLVNYSLIPVIEGQYLDWRNQRWADADVGHAALHMRRVFDDQKFAATLGRSAQQTILTEFSPARVGERIQRRLDQINAAYK